MGGQIIITDDKPDTRPDVVVIQPVTKDEEAKVEKTTVTETVEITRTEQR